MLSTVPILFTSVPINKRCKNCMQKKIKILKKNFGNLSFILKQASIKTSMTVFYFILISFKSKIILRKSVFANYKLLN